MFINVALTKINDLIKREDFKSIEFIDDKNVTILFENKGCNVNESGRVTWGEDKETETTWLKDSNTKLNKPTVSNPVEAVVMSRRDYFAAAALQGLLANSFSDGHNQPLSMASQEEMAAMARDQADHLIKALAS